MWPFNTKKKLTSDQFALVLIELTNRRSGKFLEELRSFAESRWPDFNSDQTGISVRQVLIAYFWTASRFFGTDKKALDALHERHFLACYNRGQTKEEKGRLGNAAQAELSERYTVYYKAWPDMDPSRAKEYFSNVSFEMAQSFFPSRKPVIDVSLQVMIPLEIAGFIEQAKKLRKTVAITDS